MQTLTIFYDGNCPLCSAEMRQLRSFDRHNQLITVNLHDSDFSQRYPYVDRQQALQILYGQSSSGEVLRGLDVTCRAWSLVGHHSWLQLLRWRVIKPIADRIYLLFARHRSTIARWLVRSPNCSCRYTNTDTVK